MFEANHLRKQKEMLCWDYKCLGSYRKNCEFCSQEYQARQDARAMMALTQMRTKDTAGEEVVHFIMPIDKFYQLKQLAESGYDQERI